MANTKNLPVQEIAQRHAAGESLRSLARAYGVQVVTISRKLKAAGHDVRAQSVATTAFNEHRPPSISPPEKQTLKEQYDSGLSLYALGDLYGVSPSTIKKWMDQYELPRRPRGEATRAANLRRPQGNGSRGGSAQVQAQYRIRDKRLKIVQDYRNARGCERCGEKHPAVLELHHLDRSEKHRALKGYRTENGHQRVGRGWRAVPLRDMETELAKCIVLCANCHKIIEWEARMPTT